MSNASAGRDLLFGLLALQNNFIDRNALVDAFQRRTAETGKPLDAILLERGALAPSLHSILTALAAETKAKREAEQANEKTKAALASETKAKQDTQEALARSEAVLGFLKDDVLAAARPEGQEGGLGVTATVRQAVAPPSRGSPNGSRTNRSSRRTCATRWG